MGPIPAEYSLSPQPFRAWIEDQLVEDGLSDGIGGHVVRYTFGQLAEDMEVDDRRLYAWRVQNRTLDRRMIEPALERVDVPLTDLYPACDPIEYEEGFCPACIEDVPVDGRGCCLWCSCPTEGSTHRHPGANGRLRDRHVRALHRLHTSGGLTIRELSRRIWRQVGYASPKSAEMTIRRGFKRLGLEVVNRRVNPAPPEHRRCTGTNGRGERCPGWSMLNSDVCWMHHPDNRDELSRRARVENARRMKAAA